MSVCGPLDCARLGDRPRRAFLSSTLCFCSSSEAVIKGRTGREKFDVKGLTIGALPARLGKSELAEASLGDETITVGTGEIGGEGEGGSRDTLILFIVGVMPPKTVA